MASLFQIVNACKNYGSQVLLDHADAVVSDNVKTGFVGSNGAGKSTLLRILLGEEELDSGEIIRHPSLRLGYLRQHDPFLPGETALEYLMRDSEQPDWKCGEVAGQFEMKGDYLNGPIAKLSGGWQTRLKLAALLLHEPNLLMLDEPTNFLDLRTQILLEHFLRSFRAGCLIVSHDRSFLNSTCDHTLALSRGKLSSFPGKVDAFLENQHENRLRDERSNEATRTKMKHLETFIAKNKARAATAKLAQSKSKALEKLELIDIVGAESVVNIRPPRIEPRKGPAVRCRDLVIGYPERVIASDVQWEIEHGSRVAIVGDNGQGKTTFLRTLVESLKPLGGEVKWGHGCKIGTYAQHVYTTLDPERTVFDYLRSKSVFGKKDQEILDLAGSFLFKGSTVEKPIKVLSGGERARLVMAGLMLSEFNVLVLDEPGNHLDLDSVEALADALCEYQGTVIFTSHDRTFLKKVATGIVEVRDGRVVAHHGKYEHYLAKVEEEIEAGERELASARAALPADVLRPKAKIIRTEKEIRKEIKQVERNIAELDAKRKTAKGLEVEAIGLQLLEAEDRWEQLQQELETVTG